MKSLLKTSSSNLKTNTKTQEHPIKNVDQNKLITEFENLKVSSSGWLKISSPEFKNPEKFPPVPMPDFSYKKIKVNPEYFRLNDLYNSSNKKDDKSLPPNEESFWFRLSDKNIYYTNSPNDLHVLGSITLKSIVGVQENVKNNDYCFDIMDQLNSKWKLCSETKKENHQWICGMKKSLDIFDDECNAEIEDNSDSVVVEQTHVDPVILIPLPSKNCNEKWNYFKSGADWDCDCNEGMSQSPIDIETKKVKQSPVKPLFQYEELKAKEKIIDNDGTEAFKSNIKISYKDNAIKITTLEDLDFGKVITLDGAIYTAQEIVFHSPSQHKINGKTLDMEIEVIHYGKTDITKQVVLSLLFEKKPGVYNKFMEDIDFFNLPNPMAKERDIDNDLFIPKLFYDSDSKEMPVMRPFSFYTYAGSLTAPPCHERTIHYVASKAIPIGNATIELFKEALKIPDTVDKDGNVNVNTDVPRSAREIKPLNGRHVYYYDIIANGYTPPDNSLLKRRNKPKGHYERVTKKMINYMHVSDDEPTGLPGAFVVSKDEAKGH